MRRIKLFSAKKIEELEKMVNEWIEKNNEEITIISQQLQVPISPHGSSSGCGYVDISSTQDIILSLLYQSTAKHCS